jgi:brefeldin A-inhibited guanine nucleotide-exchange protein
MKSSDSVAVQRLCLEGFRHAIHIAAQFYMELERDAFVQALTGFTGLLTGTRTLKARNVCMRPDSIGCSRLLTTSLAPFHWQIESFRTLLLVASSEGNYLQKAWYPVLRCISALENANVSHALKRSNSSYSTDSGVGALDETRDSLTHGFGSRRSSVAMSSAGCGSPPSPYPSLP